MVSPPLYYSYPTCGYLDDRSPETQAKMLQQQIVRVAYLNNSAGFSGAYFLSGKWQGPTRDYWQQILSTAQAAPQTTIELTVSPWPNTSLPWPAMVMQPFRTDFPTSKSIFDSCVYATGLGYVDVCIGAFTINEARIKVSQMVEFFKVNVQLVVKQTIVPPSTADLVNAVYAPFTNGLWLMLFGFVAAANLLIGFHNRIANPEPLELGSRKSFRECLDCSVLNLYFGWQAYWGGGLAPEEPESPAARLTSMGLGIFMLMTCATYVATVAAGLVQPSVPTSAISRVQDIIDNPSYKICCEAQLASAFTSKLGIPPSQIVSISSRGGVLSTLDAGGTCDAAGVYDEDLLQAHSQGTFCDYQSVWFLLQVGQGVPVSDRVARTMQWYHQQLDVTGTFDNLLKQVAVGYGNTCPPLIQTSATLEPADLLGAIVTAGFFFLLGLAVTLIQCIVRMRHEQLAKVHSEEQEDDKDQQAGSPSGAQGTSTSPKGLSSEEASRLCSRIDNLIRRLDGKDTL